MYTLLTTKIPVFLASAVVLKPVSFAYVTPLGRKYEVKHVNDFPGWVGGFINPSLFLQCGETAPALILTAAVDHKQADSDNKSCWKMPNSRLRHSREMCGVFVSEYMCG